MRVKRTWISVAVGLAVVCGWSAAPVCAGGKETVEVSVDELRKISERLQQLEENVRAKDERIRRLEERLGGQAQAPQDVTKVVEQHETRLNDLQEELHAPLGGEFSLMPGGQSGPFETGNDFFIAGALDVPLWRKDPLFGQKLLGEVMIGYGRSTDEGVFTSPLTIYKTIADLPAGSRVISNKVEAKFLQVFLGAKYKLVDYGMEQLQKIVQPYVVTGLGLNVVLGRTSRAGIDTDGDGRPDVTLSSLGFPGGLIGGVVPEARELSRRGFPTGQGNIKLAYSLGGGVDVNLTERLFVGADARYSFLDGGGDYGTYTGKVGFRW